MTQPALQALLRYGLVATGPVLVAGAQFGLALLLLQTLGARPFGQFSFVMIVVQLAQGLWGALFCAPMLLCVTGQGDARAMQAIRLVAACAGVLAGLATGGIALALGMTIDGAGAAGLFTFTFLARWLRRSQFMALGRTAAVVWSDLLFGIALVIVVAAVHGLQGMDARSAFLALAVASFAGMASLHSGWLREGWAVWAQGRFGDYRPVWRRHASWSLVGVVTTEVTANSHAYLVTLLLGPAAFAPIAATALLARPIAVGMNATMDFERAAMARSLGKGDSVAAWLGVAHLRILLLLLWIACALAALAVLLWFRTWIFPPQYPAMLLALGCSLWFAVALARLLRAGESALLQASGNFRDLALASLYACGGSLLGVAVLLMLAPPIWSVAGILLGEAIFTGWAIRAARARVAP